jgi:hypothetical protein
MFMRRIRLFGLLVALVSAVLLAAPVAQAAPQQNWAPASQEQTVMPDGGPTVQGWAFVCSRYVDVGVRHRPGGPAFAQILGGSDIYVDDYRDRVWVHISWPVSGYILYSVVCQ